MQNLHPTLRSVLLLCARSRCCSSWAGPRFSLGLAAARPVDVRADDESRAEQELVRQDARRRARHAEPVAVYAPPSFLPFGDRFLSPLLRNGDTNGLLLTPLGHRIRDPQAP